MKISDSSFFTSLFRATLFVALMAPAAHAGPAVDPAYDERGQFISDSWGKCVRTKWQDNQDACAPAAPPPPAPVAAPAPAPAPAPVVELEQRTIYFEFDSAELDSESVNKLNHLVQVINQSKQIGDVQIVGFTDQFGTSEYNQKLSEARVKAVEEYLDQRSRLDTQAADIRGLGKAPPEAECQALKQREDRIGCMRKERRVEIEFKYVAAAAKRR
jgi:outer membrane protein OmpA-like peptidoglycan-associated protein